MRHGGFQLGNDLLHTPSKEGIENHGRNTDRQAGQRAGSTKWVELTERMEKAVWDQRKLYANVDLYSASVYYTLGIPPAYFTPVFAMSRIAGWCAHLIEQYANNKLIRPGEHYVGARGVKYVPLAERKADIAV